MLVSFPDPPRKNRERVWKHVRHRSVRAGYILAPIRLLRHVQSRMANSSVYSDHHGDQLTRLSKFRRENKVWNVDTEALRGNRSFHFCICMLTSRLRQKLSVILLASRRNSTVFSLYVRSGSGQFLVKSDMLYSFSNKLDRIKTKHILCVEVCLVFMKII